MIPPADTVPGDPALAALTDRICAAIEGSAQVQPVPFDALAQDLAQLQRARLPAWAGMLAQRGLPETAPWHTLPPVPTLAFKHFALFAGQGPPRRTFTTSGTSGSTPGRACFGPHGLRAMASSIRVNAGRMLFPDELPPTRILVLAPPPSAAPGMIMATGMAQLVEEFGLPGSRFLVGPDGLDRAGLMAELMASAAGDAPPLTLIGASFGFVHLLDAMAAGGTRIRLPAGSRLMHAGGFKGRSRRVSPHGLRELFGHHLGLPAGRCVNLLGMTELASQIYDSAVLWGDPEEDAKVCPPWVRTEVVDPQSLEPVPPGTEGVLRHTDLANVDHPFCILTDDRGLRLPDGPGGERRFQVFGRLRDDQSRGCSLAVEEWMAGGAAP